MNQRVLLIGYGSIGAKRAGILRDCGWELTIWEPDAYRRVTARADGFTDVQPGGNVRRELPPGATVAFVCSPPAFHADHAIACLEAGCHVFIEKPIAHTLQAAHEIVAAHDASNCHVMVGCNFRFSYTGHRFKPEHIDRLEITMRYHLPTARPDWRESYANDPAQGGVVLDSGAHAIDLARWLVGPIARIDWIDSPWPELEGAVEDAATIHLQHKNGIDTTILLDWGSKPTQHQLRFLTKYGHRWVSGLWDGTDAMFQRETRAFLRAVTRVPISSSPPNPPEEATETLRWCLEARDMVRDAIAEVVR